MKQINEMTQLEIGAYVCSHLAEKGIEVVLSGGASVSLYSNNKYISKDIDLVDIYSVSRRKLISAMQEIGFVEQHRYFKHPESIYIVEFPPGPLTVGDEVVNRTHQVKLSTGILKVISATDCVKDRLAAYYHWGDKQSLSQAILVSKENKVNIEELNSWSKREGKQKEFELIKDKL
jgi:hypothetical protein